jgi:hypothetical protein
MELIEKLNILLTLKDRVLIEMYDEKDVDTTYHIYKSKILDELLDSNEYYIKVAIGVDSYGEDQKVTKGIVRKQIKTFSVYE